MIQDNNGDDPKTPLLSKTYSRQLSRKLSRLESFPGGGADDASKKGIGFLRLISYNRPEYPSLAFGKGLGKKREKKR